jgi:hypothetical protein
MSLSEERRREMIRDAGPSKKGHHWGIWLADREGETYTIVEVKTQFKSEDGKLVAERVSREWYTVLETETSYIVASVPGRTYAKGLIAELGPVWAEKMKHRHDPDTIRGVRAICEKYKAKYC